MLDAMVTVRLQTSIVRSLLDEIERGPRNPALYQQLADELTRLGDDVRESIRPPADPTAQPASITDPPYDRF
jgi:hypothetical protein